VARYHDVMRSITVDISGPTHVVDYGGTPTSGHTFVLIHGLGGSTVNWLDVGPHLAQHGRVLALDLPGFGRTPPAGRSPHIDHQEAFVARFIDSQVGTPATVIGNSMGGLIAMLTAARHPELVERLVLINPAAPAPSHIRSIEPTMLAMAAGVLIPPLGRLALRSYDRRFTPTERIIETFSNIAADPARIPESTRAAHITATEERRTQPWSHRAFMTAYRSILLRLLPHRFGEVLEAITAPTLLMHGTMDRIVPYEAARRLAARRPDWTFESLRNVGHVPMLEIPGHTAELITDWLATQTHRAA